MQAFGWPSSRLMYTLGWPRAPPPPSHDTLKWQNLVLFFVRGGGVNGFKHSTPNCRIFQVASRYELSKKACQLTSRVATILIGTSWIKSWDHWGFTWSGVHQPQSQDNVLAPASLDLSLGTGHCEGPALNRYWSALGFNKNNQQCVNSQYQVCWSIFLMTCFSHPSLLLPSLSLSFDSPFSLFLLWSSPSYLNTYIILPLLSSVSRGICARPGAKVYFSFQAAQ